MSLLAKIALDRIKVKNCIAFKVWEIGTRGPWGPVALYWIKMPFWRMSTKMEHALLFIKMYLWTTYQKNQTIYIPISKVWNRSDKICSSYRCNTSKMGEIEKIQGQITQIQLTDLAHIRTWPVFHRDLPISKVWNRSDNICSSYRCNTSKMGKIEEIQGQITQFRLTEFAHIQTWPVISRHLLISKVWNRSDVSKDSVRSD